MENRKKLHDSGLVLIVIGILNLFMFISTIVDSILDGDVAKELAAAEGDVLVAVIVVLVIICVLMALLVVADILLGIKALKVSKNPNASKGYITVAKVFLIFSCIATISHAINVFSGGHSAVDAGLNAASTTLSVCVYTLFIIAAEAVRKDVLSGEK